MAAPRTDPGKIREAQAALAEGDKAVSTSLLKWKPNYVDAEPAYLRAAMCFKAGGMLDAAVAAWRKAADCALKLGSAKKAVTTLETASRELQYASSTSSGANNYKEQAAAMLSEGGDLLFHAGEPPRAAEMKLRAGKLLEGFANDRAAALYDEAASYFEGDEDRDVYAKDALAKVFAHQLSAGRHASAMRTMDKLAGACTARPGQRMRTGTAERTDHTRHALGCLPPSLSFSASRLLRAPSLGLSLQPSTSA